MPDSTPSILLVDDDPGVVQLCTLALSHEGYHVTSAASGHLALECFAAGEFAVAVLDLVLPDVDGLSLLSALREADPDIIVILMTGHASLDTAIDAVRRGAYDYLRKPFGVGDLTRVVSRGLAQRELTVQNRALLRELDLVNRELTQKVKTATTELTAFISLGRSLDRGGGSQPVIESLLNAGRQITGATTAAVFTTAGSQGLHCTVSTGEAAASLLGLQLPGEDPLTRRTLEANLPVAIPALLHEPELAAGPLALLGFTAVMAMPLHAVSGPAGLLLLLDPPQPFTERHAHLVKVVAAQIAEVVTLARLTETPPAEDTEGGFVDLRKALGAD